jgi:nicotinate dehydrogenase subunit A
MRIETVAGLRNANGVLHPVQQAFLDEQAAQCGYCTAGLIIAGAALLATNPDPSESDVRAALDGHLCRCGAHNRVVRAILRAAKQGA